MNPEHRARCEEAIVRLGMSKAQARELFEAGYQTPRFVREATDAELLDVEGIGVGTVKRIRKNLSRRD